MKKNNSEKSRIFFDKVANTNYGNSEKLDKYILEKIVIEDKISILDLGCGDGRFLEKIRNLNENNILYGLDISEKMLDIARNKNIEGCNFILGDSTHLPYKNKSIDMIFCLNSFHHYSNPSLAIKEMKRVLKPGGKVVIGDIYTLPIIREIINLYLPYSKSGDYKMYSKKSLNNLFIKEGFENTFFSVVSPWLFISEYKKQYEEDKR